ncbi:branched-chain amino acid ABC transporter permease [Blastococcus tunisiensis]|uniref:Amino acid/amide ABC transporter membrane protein 1, HAAT family n=1 Tax=Blastococcus tunisiensis TaxID=1798228 RepID=A0A1I2JKR7_9ACTN|nr:branched-chain amino acid ABC transporter permease [Blastococcus sp. DSM 46838]SFF54708.1 amino acid/amide ABC transporter membrane protein 1, HAAT family [Blastococcus sp. DSM 46838]
MIKFLSLLLAGLSLGSMYALVAMGFVIIYKASGVANFAHGSLLLIGATFVAFTHDTLGFGPAVLVALLGTAASAFLLQFLFIRPMRTASPIPTTIVTIGMDILLLVLLTGLLGEGLHELGQPWAGDTVVIGDVGITVNRLIGLIVAALLIVGFLVLFKRSAWGISMRAAAEDPEAAALVGLRLGRVTATTWIIAGVLACVAAIFLTGAPTPGLSPALWTVALVAFPAAIIGGLTSVHGALVGGLVIGVAESLATGYQQQLLFLGRGFGIVVPFVVLLVVLLVRPEGLFSARGGRRV